MRRLCFFALLFLPIVARAQGVNCEQQQIEVVRQMNRQVHSAQSLLLHHVMLLQKNEQPQDADEIRTRCEKVRGAVDEWEHSSHATSSDRWVNFLDAQKAFSKYMLGVIGRDRPAWDKSLENMKASGYNIHVDYDTFVLTLTKDLAPRTEGQGMQRLKTVMDFCGPEAVDGDHGTLSSQILVRGKEHGAKTVVMTAAEYARANLSIECGVSVGEGTEFLRTGGALRSSKSASALPAR